MRPTAPAAVLALLCPLATPLAAGAQTLTITPPNARPGLPLTLTGAGFANNQAVDVYVDTTDTVLLVSSSTGTLSGTVPVPTTATPGAHSITAVGRRAGDAAQASVNVTTPWAQFGFGLARQSTNPYENVLTPDNVGSIGTLWTLPIGAGGTLAVVNGRAYLGYLGGVTAVSAANGTTIWNKTFSGETFYAAPAVVANAVYVASSNGTVRALAVATGATIWTRSLGNNIFGAPLVVGSMVYVTNYSGVVTALNAATGTTIWSFTAGGGIDSSPAYANGTLYFGCDDDKIYALNAATGAQSWTYTTGGAVESAPAIANGALYVGSDDGLIYAIGTSKTNAGGLLWSYTTGGPVYANPAVANNTVYVGSQDDKLYALTASNGNLAWSFNAGALVRSAAIANGVAYVTAQNGTLYALDAGYGGQLASARVGYTYFGGPAVADGRIFVSTSLGDTYALALKAGSDAIPRPDPHTLHPNLALPLTR